MYTLELGEHFFVNKIDILQNKEVKLHHDQIVFNCFLPILLK